jgi:hypothetical protein
MKLQVILSSAALVAAMALSGPALAQLSLSVPSEREQAVRDACTALQAQATASTIEQDDDDDANLETGSTSDQTGQSDSGDPASEDYWDVVIAGLTIDDCKAMGL